jgi:hypothetical protein
VKLVDQTCPFCRAGKRDTPMVIGGRTVMVGCADCMEKVRRRIVEEFGEDE